MIIKKFLFGLAAALNLGAQSVSAQHSEVSRQVSDTVYVEPQAGDTIAATLGVQLLTGLESYVTCHDIQDLGKNKLITGAQTANITDRSNVHVKAAVVDNPCGHKEGQDGHSHAWSLNSPPSVKPSAQDYFFWTLSNYRNRKPALHCIFTLEKGACYEGITVKGEPIDFPSFTAEEFRKLILDVQKGTIRNEDFGAEREYVVVFQRDTRARLPDLPSLNQDILRRARLIRPDIINRPYNSGKEFSAGFIATRTGYKYQR